MIFPAAQIIHVTNASSVKLKVETFAFVVSIELCINLKYKSIWVILPSYCFEEFDYHKF